MIGRLYINNKDAFGVFGAVLADGSYEALLKPAPGKGYTENKFRSQDGKRIFADNPRFDERDLQLTIYVSGSDFTDYITKYKAFLEEIRNGIIEFKVTDLKTIYKLIYMDCNKYGDYGLTRGKFVIDFNEPNPVDRIEL